MVAITNGMHLDRRFVVAGAGASLLAACSPEKPAPKKAAEKVPPATLEKVLAGDWRPEADKARDAFRHPAESLAFWGLKPATTVVEFWPGAGWYSDILAPYLDQTGGRFYAAVQEAAEGDAATTQMVEAYKRRLQSRKRLYGDVQFTAFGPNAGPVAPAGSANLVLFLRNIHNWMAGGIAEKAFADAFAALRPGGVLGVEEHRGNIGEVQDVLAGSGYVQEAYVKQLAAEAGFRFDKSSEINANLEDTKDHPFGVWTLPPVRRTSPRGQPTDPTFDRAPFDAIGESDRMTLRFVKPG